MAPPPTERSGHLRRADARRDRGGVELPVQWSPDGRVPIEVECCMSAWVLISPHDFFNSTRTEEHDQPNWRGG